VQEKTLLLEDRKKDNYTQEGDGKEESKSGKIFKTITSFPVKIRVNPSMS